MAWGHFKQYNYQKKKKAQKCEKKPPQTLALDRPQKGHLFTIVKLKREVRASPCLTLAGNVYIG